MPRFRKRPIEFDAEQWFPGKKVPGVRGVNPSAMDAGCFVGGKCCRPHIHTAHNGQVVELEPGDYVVAEPDGRGFYPVKPDIFEKFNEPVE